MRPNAAALLVAMVRVLAMGQSPAMAQLPASTQSPASTPSAAGVQSPASARSPAGVRSPAGAQSSAPAVGDNGLLLGIELGVARGIRSADRFGLMEIDGYAGWVSHRRAALFATVSLGFLGATEPGLFASLGLGGRMWADRAFVDLRIERMSVTVIECDEDCSAVGLNRYSAGVGVDAVRGTHGGMQLTLKMTHMASVSAVMLSIGGYVEL
jgi:hypothetical protein